MRVSRRHFSVAPVQGGYLLRDESANGTLVWRQTLNTYWSNKDLTIGDVTGDGVQDVIANGPGTGGDGLWYLDCRTGAKEVFVPTTQNGRVGVRSLNVETRGRLPISPSKAPSSIT